MLLPSIPIRRGARRAAKECWDTVEKAKPLVQAYCTYTDNVLLLEASRIRESFLTIYRKSPRLLSQGMRSSRWNKDLSQPLALVCAAVKREHGFIPYPVQMFAALSVASGCIIDMKTGEGKSIVAVMAAHLLSLSGEAVHVSTTNDYLAVRDAEDARNVLSRLGLSVGAVIGNDAPDVNRRAYQCDITYGPGYQFGFDYLKDQAALRSTNTGQLGQRFVRTLNGTPSASLIQCRPPGYAIIDEADSVLIDEATTPLILSASEATSVDPSPYMYAHNIAKQLLQGKDYRIKLRAIEWLEEGHRKVTKPSDTNLGTLKLVRPWITYVENALLALHVYSRNDQYVVMEDKVQIVDNLTGRIHSDRSWQNGLHQAIEYKEQVELTSGRKVLARITRQRFFQRYIAVSGLTGTVGELGHELKATYNADSVLVPSHRPCKRVLMPTRVFLNWESKLRAVAEEVCQLHSQGRPVLIGTRNIARSLEVFEHLKSLRINVVLLNGMQDQAEAEIIAQAGESGAVTIATNMAGRGTDIRLTESSRKQGGLHVIGIEPHDSNRIDLQLIGRSARQGDPGSARLYTSFEDHLFKERDMHCKGRMEQKANKRGEICNSDLQSRILALQLQNERKNQAIRERISFHDRWLDTVKKDCESFS